MKNDEFIECDTCRAKSGTPTLCQGCLSNRELITQLKASGSLPQFIAFTGKLSQVWVDGVCSEQSGVVNKNFEKVIPIRRITSMTRDGDEYTISITSADGASKIFLFKVNEEDYMAIKKLLLQLKEEKPSENKFHNSISGLEINETL